jgi:hypothetical protein
MHRCGHLTSLALIPALLAGAPAWGQHEHPSPAAPAPAPLPAAPGATPQPQPGATLQPPPGATPQSQSQPGATPQPQAGATPQPHPQPGAEPQPAAQGQPADHAAMPGMEGMEGMDMANMAGMQGMQGMPDMPGMAAFLGPYGMTREASGTSWQPESSPHEGLHWSHGPWQLMTHGYAMLVHSDQAGGERATKTFSENMLMTMASRPLGAGRLGLRAMLSAEPWTIGKTGYPLVLQTGETADGVTPLRDRQHPHDLFMELAATYSLPLGAGSSVFVYLGEPGEPALGPPAFMHRFSGMENPEAPLSHHWLDSTHISLGVVTVGWVRGGWKLEGSAFNGHEPDPKRYDLDAPKLNSYSFRASYQPAPDWSLQASVGHLSSPEQLEPGVDATRATVSAMYNRPFDGGNWQTTLAVGHNDRKPGRATTAVLLESGFAFASRHTLFSRVERLENDELIGNGAVATVGKLSLGYIYDALAQKAFKAGVGAVGSVARVPAALAPRYGGQTLYSWMAFVRVKLTAPPMGHTMHMADHASRALSSARRQGLIALATPARRSAAGHSS